MAEIRYKYDETTNTKVPYRHTELPTAEEYAERASIFARHEYGLHLEPKYQCPECGGGMCRNEKIVLTSYPAKYIYKCNKCGYEEYQYM